MRILSLIMLLACAASSQVTRNVPSSNYPTIQSALNVASSGDKIIVAPGIYNENLIWNVGDVELIGSGVGQTIIESVYRTHPLILFTSATTEAAIVSDITLRTAKQAIKIDAGIQITCAPTILRCEIADCTYAIQAVDGVHGMATFIDVDVHDCGAGLTSSSGTGSAVFELGKGSGIEIRDSRIHDNDDSAEYLIRGDSLPTGDDIIPVLRIENCQFNDNSNSWQLVRWPFSTAEIRRCAFVGQNSMSTLNSMISLGRTFDFAENVIKGCHNWKVLIQLDAHDYDVRNCTIVDNVLSSNGAVFYLHGGARDVINSIAWENRYPDGTIANTTLTPPPSTGTVFRSCVLPASVSYASNCFYTDPLLVDPDGADYRPGAGSPCFDTGRSLVNSLLPSGLSSVDFLGRPRVLGSQIDIGAIESYEAAMKSAANGSTGLGAGGPFDCLQLNWTTGNLLREVAQVVGESNRLALSQHPLAAGPLDFTVFGMLGEATIESLINIPLGVGDMSFLPAPLDPSQQPFFFTAASTIGPINGVAPLFVAAPAPWTSPPFVVPFPLDLSFQAVLATTPGVYEVSNLVILKVR